MGCGPDWDPSDADDRRGADCRRLRPADGRPPHAATGPVRGVIRFHLRGAGATGPDAAGRRGRSQALWLADRTALDSLGYRQRSRADRGRRDLRPHRELPLGDRIIHRDAGAGRRAATTVCSIQGRRRRVRRAAGGSGFVSLADGDTVRQALLRAVDPRRD